MLRKCVSITMVFSLIALSSSGLLMIILNSFSFQLQMHPVHKIFGVIMILAGSIHLYLNFKPIKVYLKNRKVLILASILSILLILLFAVGLSKPIDQEKVKQVQQLMFQMETKQ